MFPGCVNSDYASKCANQLAAGARVHAAQIPQGTGIRHTPHMSVFKIDDQSCEVAINVQRLVTNRMSDGRLRECFVFLCMISHMSIGVNRNWKQTGQHVSSCRFTLS